MRDLLVRRIDQCFGFASAGRSDVYLNKQTNKSRIRKFLSYLAKNRDCETHHPTCRVLSYGTYAL